MPKYALLIDYEYCTGCHGCEVACKEEHGFGVGKFNHIPVPTDLCDLCADRVGRGRKPVCVHNCLGDCMRFGTIEELSLELAKKPKQVLWAPTD